MSDLHGTIAILWLAIALVYGIGYVLLLLHSTLFGLYGLFGVVTFGNFVAEYGPIPDQVNWLTEISILLLFLKSFVSKKSHSVTGYRIFFPFTLFFFLLFAIASMIINRSNPISAVLCLRLMFRYVILFIALVNLDLQETEVLKLNKLVVGLVLIQLPVAVIKFFFYGQGESAVGTYAGIHGGTLSTVLPLAVIPFAIGYYFYHKRSIMYFLISIAFVGYSVIGGKRAFIFYLGPLLIYLFLVFRRQLMGSIRPRELILCALLVLGAFLMTTGYVNTLNPERISDRLQDPQKKGYGAVMEYAYKYNTVESVDGIPQGRISSTLKVLDLLNDAGILGWAFGYGPGTMMKSRFTDGSGYGDSPIGYGKTQFNWTAYQFGIFATMLYFMIPFKLLLFTRKFSPRLDDDEWRALFFGLNALCFTMILMGLTYCYNLMSDFLPCIFFYLAAVAVKKVERFQS